jgi:YHS domain-containing protein
MKAYPSLTITLLLLACNSTPTPDQSQTEVKPQPVVTAPVEARPAEAPATLAAEAELILVSDSSQVCMVNNQFMGRPQIPVEVGGKTYFGCCEMCKKRLADNPAARAANDPVSGKPVDKAMAVIARRATGEVLYFESTENFERYRAM